MNPFQQPDEAHLLAHQKEQCPPGRLTYEQGLEIKEVTGYVATIDYGVVVFGDYATLIRHQNRTLVPWHRVVELQLTPNE